MNIAVIDEAVVGEKVIFFLITLLQEGIMGKQQLYFMAGDDRTLPMTKEEWVAILDIDAKLKVRQGFISKVDSNNYVTRLLHNLIPEDKCF
jgi:hypothetical protein